MQFVEIDVDGTTRMAGYAPYLDYRPPTAEEQARLAPILRDDWLSRDLAKEATSYAIANGVGGAVTVAHDGRYGDLSGKTVALEPATGFSFDSPMLPRVH